jgi:putative ABC transport system ATP-binding protein
MVKLKNVVKKYSGCEYENCALNDITLEINDGEMVAVVGRSGSGKTTLLNIIGCMDRVTSGEYIYNGNNIHEYKRDEFNLFRKDNVSFIFQHFALMEQYTVYENVEMPLIAKGIRKKERKKKIENILKRFELIDIKHKYPNNISGGQRQRTAIARAVITENNLILADEPTGALDKVTGNMIIDYLAEINKEGKTLIIVTHDESIAARCDRIIRIEDGKLL